MWLVGVVLILVKEIVHKAKTMPGVIKYTSRYEYIVSPDLNVKCIYISVVEYESNDIIIYFWRIFRYIIGVNSSAGINLVA